MAVNYRLGPLGFLATKDGAATGNFGLKDQILALKWVQKNIAVFGGDPDNVTLMGEDSGAASATIHILSPEAKGLFHKVLHVLKYYPISSNVNLYFCNLSRHLQNPWKPHSICKL